MWLKLKFDGVYEVNDIKIYSSFYTDWPNKTDYFVSSKDIYESTKTSSSTRGIDVLLLPYDPVYLHHLCGTWYLNTRPAQHDQIYEFTCDNFESDGILVWSSDKDLIIYEVEAFGTLVASGAGEDTSGPGMF